MKFYIYKLSVLFLINLFISNCSVTNATKQTNLKSISLRETQDSSQIEKSELIILKISRIPGAGMGVFATKDISKGTEIGEYKGKFISDEEYWKLVNADEWHYVMGLDECSYKFTNGIKYIDGRVGNFTTRINFAPEEFQNVKFKKVCEKPYVVVIATKDIKKDDEIYVDYGPNYIYDFMELPEVKNHFNTERKKLKK